jgi:cytoskeletal protein RodZ
MGEFGDLLRNARAYRGVTLADAERTTRIHRRYLAALEQEAFDVLPPLTYARGIVRTYAQYLGLDPVTVLAKFEEAHGQRSGGFRVVPAVKSVPRTGHWAPNFAIIAFMVVISAVVFAWIYSALSPHPQQAPTLLLAGTPTATIGSIATITPAAALATPPAFVVTATPTATQPSTVALPSSAPSPTSLPPSPTPSPTPASHTFIIAATDHVWVEASVDGTVALAKVMNPGERVTLQGKTLFVTSGNAPKVRVYVDGQDRGPLGSTWSESQTYP